MLRDRSQSFSPVASASCVAANGLGRGPLWVTGCRDDGLPATDGLPLTADALLQRGETAKSTTRVNSLRKSTATYPLVLRAVDFTVSTKPPTQGMIAATAPADGGRDGMVFSPDQEFCLD